MFDDVQPDLKPAGDSPVDDGIRRLIKDLYTPLETPARPERDRERSASGLAAERADKARADLAIAREAARKAFNVRPSFFTRRAAGQILSR